MNQEAPFTTPAKKKITTLDGINRTESPPGSFATPVPPLIDQQEQPGSAKKRTGPFTETTPIEMLEPTPGGTANVMKNSSVHKSSTASMSRNGLAELPTVQTDMDDLPQVQVVPDNNFD